MRRGKSTKPEEGAAPAPAPAPEKKEDGAANPYENSIKTICTVSTVEEFWQVYNYLQRPSELPSTTDYHFFRSGIKPTWEDSANAKGGKWIVRLPKGLASRYWEEVVLALIGGQFSGVPDGEITGLVISVRYSEDILGVWNRTSNDREITERIREAIKKVLQLPNSATLEYKPHQSAMADRSSFRPTSSWKTKGAEGRPSGSDHQTRRKGSWGERDDKPKNRDTERSWR
jgi:translation initiation factor 4E